MRKKERKRIKKQGRERRRRISKENGKSGTLHASYIVLGMNIYAMLDKQAHKVSIAMTTSNVKRRVSILNSE